MSLSTDVSLPVLRSVVMANVAMLRFELPMSDSMSVQVRETRSPPSALPGLQPRTCSGLKDAMVDRILSAANLVTALSKSGASSVAWRTYRGEVRNS